MRFDIGPGGAFAIMLGLAGLSGAVFVLGLVAGYEMGYQTQIETSQVATVYPMPSAGAITPTPSLSEGAAPGGAARSSSALSTLPETESSARLAARPASKPATGYASTTGAPPAGTAAVASQPAVGEGAGSTAARGQAASREPSASAATSARAVTAPKAPPSAGPEEASREAPVRKPYNIQIEAAMDRNGADNMAQRLRELGYQPTIVATDIGGQTWYRVKVGPYASEEEARQAQQELEAAYKAHFSSH